MNRPIKYRFWRDGKMQQAHQLNAYINTDNNFSGDGEILMQFTGLTDKNGKEIYEGDIVDVDDYSNGAYFGINQPRKRITIQYQDLSVGIGFHILHKNNAEIIGNIYENPELL